ncbi:MAG: hypothetical protein U0995_08905 [Erythrobacter sp.]|nr:hypothetical protein [Erythrobacter sp.]MDZ4272964.1 hypothetical protein [Erythrobacter sp.]MDZ4276144.1 hypothetical protein [Erythrobacter sp.]
MTVPAAPLPQVLDEIARVAGDEAAWLVAEAVGGVQVYIPPTPDADHWLTRLLGRESALRIADHFTGGFGGRRLEIPLGDTGFMVCAQRKCDAMLLAGRSERDIARACGYTIRGVRKRRARLKMLRDTRQGELFAG